MSDDFKWEPDLKQQDLVTIDELKFMFSEADKMLSKTTNSGNLLVTRTAILCTVTVAILTACTSYIINSISNEIDYPGFITCSLALLYFFRIAAKLKFNLQSHNFYEVGEVPSTMWNSWLFENFTNSDVREKQFYILQLKQYQYRIDKNKAMLDKRWKIYNKSLTSLIFSPVLIAVYICFKLLFTLL
jgi:hypothetical protein